MNTETSTAKKVDMIDLMKLEINLLFLITPVIYFISKVIGNQSIYALKDILMGVLCVQIILYYKKHNTTWDKKTIMPLIIYICYILLSTILRMDDITFWLIGIREVLFTPIMLIVIGSYISGRLNFFHLIRKSLLWSALLTVVFSFVFRNLSYGATNRLSSFWDSEHEPGIIGGLLIAIYFLDYYLSKSKDIKPLILPILLGSFCMIQSKSRSVIIALFLATLFITYNKLNLKNLSISATVTLIFIVLIENYEKITSRQLNYNLSARTDQYKMAKELIISHPLFGIGIDKYGVLAGRVKALYFGNYHTTTMDSTLIKYCVNLGLIFMIILFLIIISAYNKVQKTDNRGLFSVVIFGFFMGCITGKLGAYPLNQYVYTTIGYCLFQNSNVSIVAPSLIQPGYQKN